MIEVLTALAILLAVSAIACFSLLAARLDQKMWQKCSRKDSCLRSQQQITLGKSHCR